ncbi:hypothetical protein GCM10018793_28970 [Streptomyces sulfonofaciens]|uniref:DUF4190 domain-containing protein n=1 Tax=Streptomyces sulfonofaciens TaxID=68272 RepID=A0A919G561_9ACTN|nr:DUF1707 and DUF4190 domain-containing protein [Streptomyces sulfonofaciens]GHH78457.1 hypothetical protein GCM10018793_28970 [Streptomyces sulfonofaciens]
MLAAHADRERAVDVLRAGFAEGRLKQGEYEQRVEQAYRARTVGELGVLVADLPQGPVPQQTAPAKPSATPPVPRTFLPTPLSDTNPKSIGALTFGVAGFATVGVTSIPAVVLGHMARREIRRTGERGDGMAIGGVVLGWLGLVLFVVVLIAAAV